MTSKGPFGRTLLRGLRLTGRRAPTHIKEDAFQAEPPRRKEGLRRSEAGACNCPKEKRQVNVFKIKKAENSEQGGTGGQPARSSVLSSLSKRRWERKRKKRKRFLSFAFLFSLLKRRHLRDRAEDYFRLFWATTTVSVDSNQPGSGEASSRPGA